MKFIVLFFLFFVSFSALCEEETGETCRSYVINVQTKTKYCLLDRDDKIAEFDKRLKEDQSLQAIEPYRKDDPNGQQQQNNP